MAEADKDGHIARALSDRHACLSMEMHESIQEAIERFAAVFSELNNPPESLSES